MNDADRLDLVVAIVAELGFEHLRIDPVPPVGLHHIDVQAQFGGHLNPQRGKLSDLEHHDFVAGRQSIGQCPFPGSGSGGWVNDHLPGGLKNVFHPFQDFESQEPALRASMIDGWPRHGSQHPFGHIGGPGKLYKLTTARIWHRL